MFRETGRVSIIRLTSTRGAPGFEILSLLSKRPAVFAHRRSEAASAFLAAEKVLEKIVVTDTAVLVEHPLINNLSHLMELLIIDDTKILLLYVQFKINPPVF